MSQPLFVGSLGGRAVLFVVLRIARTTSAFERIAVTAIAISVFAICGCSSNTDGGPAGPMEGSRSIEGNSDLGTGPTFYEDVAPIVYENCVYCHRDGGLGPFPLLRFEDAAASGALIADAVAKRLMPPMPVNNDGSCNTYSNARWLTQDEIDLIVEWYATGMAKGDEANAPPLPEPDPALDDSTHLLDMGVTYTPEPSVDDDYRCFVIDPMSDTDLVVTGYEVLPGEPRVVHHAIVYLPSSDEEALRLDELEAKDARAGYSCYGGAGVSSSPLVLWAPGGGAIRFPAGTGLPVPGGRKLVMQIHYNLEAGPLPDRTTIKMATAATVPEPAEFVAMADTQMELPPREEYVETSADFPLGIAAGRSVKVYGALPHMHGLGQTLRLELLRGSEPNLCLVDVDRWDFGWQGAWFYDSPLDIDLARQDRIKITCGYDTRERNEVVTWGEGTHDEMCLSYLYVTRP